MIPKTAKQIEKNAIEANESSFRASTDGIHVRVEMRYNVDAS